LYKKKLNWYAAAALVLAGGMLSSHQLSDTQHGSASVRLGETVLEPLRLPVPSNHDSGQVPVVSQASASQPLAHLRVALQKPAPATITEQTPGSGPPSSTKPAKSPSQPESELYPPSEQAVSQSDPRALSAARRFTPVARLNTFPSIAAGTLRKRDLVLAQSEPGAAINASPRPANESQATPYVDKLIDPSVAEQPVAEVLERPKGLGRYGAGSVGIEYGYYRSKATGDADRTMTENGLGITFRQATPNFGLLDFQAAVTNQTNDPEPDVGSGDALRLIQTDLPLTGNWFMDNLLGQIHAPAPASVAISYRLRLPAPLISGLATHVLHGGTTVGAAAGDLGILRGRTFPVFESTTGSITGVAATHRFNAHWGGGLQLWDVKDALVGTNRDSHTSFTGALEFRDPITQQLGQLHLLSNGGGNDGLWLDGETNRGRWQHNYGAFRLDPDLVWIDNTYAIPNDQQGIYWNGVYQTFRWSVRGGADWLETNLDDDPLVTGRKATNLFANVAYRLSPRLNVDGALRWGRQRPGAGLPSEDSDVISARSTVSYRLGRGTSFWTVGVTDFDNDTSPSTVSEFIWDYEWRIPQTRLRTGIEYQRDEQSLDTLSETQLRVIASQRFFDSRFGLNAIYTAGVAGGGTTEEGRTSSLSLNLDWRVSRALELRLDLTHNRNVVELVNGSEIRVTERTVFLGVAYQFGWNSALRTVGRSSEQGGRGRIGGTVFLDANRNGIQEPDEAGVPNVSVYLDRGFSVSTDARGYFEFWPVPVGDHTLQVAMDNVPLPWGLADESPRQVKVVPRDTVRLDYGLTKINE
jgi:hypothetical protein